MLTIAAIALLAGGQISATAVERFTAAPKVLRSLGAVLEPLGFAEQCVDKHPKLAALEPDVDRLKEQYQGAEDRVSETWGSLEDPANFMPSAAAQSCTRATVIAAIAAADRALSDHAAIARHAMATMDKGAWMGPIHLCSDLVESVTRGTDKYTGQPNVDFRFTPPGRSKVAALTASMINRPLAIRLDGVVIMRPRVNEPLTIGAVISAQDRDETALRRLIEAAQESC